METGLPAAIINKFLLVTSETSISVNSQILWTASSYSLFGVKFGDKNVYFISSINV